MMAERRDVVAGAALAAGVAVVVPQAASARGKDGKETGAFASGSYSKYQKGYPRNIAPVVSFTFLSVSSAAMWMECSRGIICLTSPTTKAARRSYAHHSSFLGIVRMESGVLVAAEISKH